ncbi:MAG: cation transporter [Kiritimatiellae bacterium]|nr:cation transporter [Kiritimatiellia bacterium]
MSRISETQNVPADAAARAKRIVRTSFVGIGANVLLSGFKAAVGLAAGSVSVVMDAVNNLTDALGSVLTLAGVQLARRAPDAKHPFGYGRIEYFSAVSIAALVLAAGAGSLVESAKKIVHPAVPDYGTVSLVVVAVAVAAKLALGRYVSAQGRACNSDALVASGADASFDAILSASTLAGALLVKFAGVNLDGWIGAGISLFILKAGLEMLFGAVSHIMGRRPDAEITKEIRATVAAVPGVLGAYDLVLHNYGPDSAIGSIHVEIDSSLDAAAIHRLTRAVQGAVLDKFRVFLTVGVYASDPARAADRAKIAETARRHPGVLGVHGVFFDDAAGAVSFDVLVDFTVRDRPALRDALAAELAPLFPGRTFAVNFDTNYSD